MLQQKELIMEVLKDVPDESVLYLSVDTTNYYIAMLSTLEYLKNHLKMEGIYITSSRSVDSIISQLKIEKIDTHALFFVDSIAILSESKTNLPGVQVVESPAMLEAILLKVKWFLRKLKNERRFIFVDSINSLAVYNEPKLLCEFLHIFMNLMRARDIMTILLSVDDQTPEAVKRVMRLSCDDFMEVKEEGVTLNGQLKTMLGEEAL